MTEQEIKQQTVMIERQFLGVIVGLDDKTPSVLVIAACINVVGTVVAASRALHQPTVDLLRNCANTLEAAARADAQASVH